MGHRAAPGAVLLREAVRTSRRGRTYALRSLFAGILLAAVGIGWWGLFYDAADASEAGMLGRRVFLVVANLQTALITLVTPVVVAQAIVEEREDGTLDLLAVTRLSAAQVLLGKVASRLVVVWALVLGATPALAMALSLGGVSSDELRNAALGAVGSGLVLAVVSAHLSLWARGVVGPVLATLVWTVPGLLFGPVLAAAVGDWRQGISAMSPLLWGLAWDDTDAPLWAPLVWAPTIAMVTVSSVVSFRIRLTADGTGADPGGGNPDVRAWNLLCAYTSLLMVVAAIGWGPALLVGGQIRAGNLPEAWGKPTALAWGVVGLHAITLWTLQVGARAFQRLDGRSEAKPRAWRLWGPLLASPVFWREMFTRAHGPGTAAAAIVTAGWVLLVLITALAGADDEGFFALCVLGGAAALVLTATLATGSAVQERRGGLLDTLLMTRLTPAGIHLARWLAVVVRTAPLGFLVGCLLSVFDDRGRSFALSVQHLALYGAWGALWPGTVAALALLVAMRARPPQAAWAVNLGVPWLVVAAPVLLRATAPSPLHDEVELIGAVFLPVLGAMYVAVRDEIWPVAFGIVLYAGVTAAALLPPIVRMRAWAEADRG
jgi:hypothetical protein